MAGAGDKGEFDYVVVLDASGNAVNFSSSGGVSMVDDAAFTPATSSFTPVGGVVTSDSVDSGDGGAFAMLANRQQKVTLYDSSGNELSVGGGTQYTEGDTDASITGTAILWEDTSNTLRAVSASKPLPIGDAGGSLTVDAPVGTPAFVRLSDGSNAISTLPVSLASVPTHAVTQSGTWNIGSITTLPALVASTAAIGKLAANSGVDIGDVDVTSLPALAAGTNAIGKLLPPDIDITTHTNYAKKYYTHSGAVTDGIIWSPASGKRWHIHYLYIQVSDAATVTLEDDKSGGDEVVWKGEFAANQGISMTFPEMYPFASGEDAADLIITTSAGNVYALAIGYEI
jgi:hypothetical protein